MHGHKDIGGIKSVMDRQMDRQVNNNMSPQLL